MSTLLRATSNLETTRIQIFKDVMSSLLGGLKTRGQASAQAQQRLLSVLHGQLLGMEGRLKEERGARMAALAGRCNLETREEMEAEHCREAAEKAQAELLCEYADQQVTVISNLHICTGDGQGWRHFDVGFSVCSSVCMYQCTILVN